MTRRCRLFATLALALTLPLGLAGPAHAQQPEAPGAEGEAKGEGRPADGYIATTALACLALFLVAKTARR